MRPPPDSKTPLLRSSRWGGAGAGGTPAGRASCSPPFSWAVRREHYSSPRLTTTVRAGAIRPSVRPVFRFPKRAEGGTHHLDADVIKHAKATHGEGYSPKCVEGLFSEVRMQDPA